MQSESHNIILPCSVEPLLKTLQKYKTKKLSIKAHFEVPNVHLLFNKYIFNLRREDDSKCLLPNMPIIQRFHCIRLALVSCSIG